MKLKEIITNWQKVLHRRGWNANYLCNHDQPRSVSRFGDNGQYRVKSAQMLATFIHMLEGTPYIYQGEEIGMTNIEFDTIDQYRDVETLNYYKEKRAEGVPENEIMRAIHKKSRDNARTPMQWDHSEQAGFTTGDPWIQVNPNYSEINVEADLKSPESIFKYYKKLIALRKKHKVIVYGEYELLFPAHEEIYAYTRTLDQDLLVVILNFSDREPIFEMPEEINLKGINLLISNYLPGEKDDLHHLKLRPYEARVYLGKRHDNL
ncbi:Oligo-1,6-glucosidase [compost metagenome]